MEESSFYWTHLLSCSDCGRILKKDHEIISGVRLEPNKGLMLNISF